MSVRGSICSTLTCSARKSISRTMSHANYLGIALNAGCCTPATPVTRPGFGVASPFMNEPPAIAVRSGVDRRILEAEIVPAALPVVLRDLVADWPLVRAARESRQSLATLLKGFDTGRQPHVIEAPAEAAGRIFYREDLSGFNFTRAPAGISATVDRLLALADVSTAPA